jgi:hypothetical protein
MQGIMLQACNINQFTSCTDQRYKQEMLRKVVLKNLSSLEIKTLMQCHKLSVQGAEGIKS